MANRQCPVCGNEYSDTYRKCPFCEEEAARRKGKTIRRRGGKRLDKKKRSGGAGGILMLVLVVVVAGVVGVAVFGEQLADLVGIRTDASLDNPPPVNSTQPDDKTGPDSQNPGGEDPNGTVADPNAPAEPAGPLTLSQSEFTIAAGETGRIIASGGSGAVTWSSSNDQIAKVADGAVTGVAGGKVTITAVSGEETQTCSVTVTGDPWVSSADIKLSKSDVTLPAKEKGFQLKVTGTENPVTWSSANTGVATVSDSGWVTWVGKGTTVISASVDGHVMECIVRCRS